ncbi:hypothetical protein D3C72_1594560 [compost metagenome]
MPGDLALVLLQAHRSRIEIGGLDADTGFRPDLARFVVEDRAVHRGKHALQASLHRHHGQFTVRQQRLRQHVHASRQIGVALHDHLRRPQLVEIHIGAQHAAGGLGQAAADRQRLELAGPADHDQPVVADVGVIGDGVGGHGARLVVQGAGIAAIGVGAQDAAGQRAVVIDVQHGTRRGIAFAVVAHRHAR